MKPRVVRSLRVPHAYRAAMGTFIERGALILGKLRLHDSTRLDTVLDDIYRPPVTPHWCNPIVYGRWREAEGGDGGATWRSG